MFTTLLKIYIVALFAIILYRLFISFMLEHINVAPDELDELKENKEINKSVLRKHVITLAFLVFLLKIVPNL